MYAFNRTRGETMSIALRNDVSGAVLEKVILGNDLAALSPIEKVQYVSWICKTLGLNPATQPIALIKFQGKEIPYMRKDGTEQLRKNNNVSITKIETKVHDGGLYVATAYAKLPNGREDSSTGAVTIATLKGDALANAMMKAETKAKRRVTLSICGLGFLDESELDTMQGAQKVDIHPLPIKQDVRLPQPQVSNLDLEDALINISQCDNVDELQHCFGSAYKQFAQARDKESLQKLIVAKDKKKQEIEETINSFNGELEQTDEVQQ
jgi:hypothetical protein